MVFMADVQLPCETCNGKRFKKVLSSSICRQNIHDILTMTIDDAVAFFETDQQHKITQNSNHCKMLDWVTYNWAVFLYLIRRRSTKKN
jgi:excinuclease UvrABC ATPase subunit